VRSTVGHAPGTTGGAETAAVATEGNKFLVMARFTLQSQKTMLKTTALQVILEFSNDITGQAPPCATNMFWK
tara:strand:+ start:307 stop:522 length:216 start_codon:yes stop_codon:yes gene_type:complete